MKRNRTNEHGLTSDTIFNALREQHPKAHRIARRGQRVCLWRKPARGEEPGINSEYIIEDLGGFDDFRLTRDGRLTTR